MIRGLLAVLCLGLAWFIQAGEHEKKPVPAPDRGPASARPETGSGSLTAGDSEAVLRDLQSSLDEFHMVTKGAKRERTPTGEVQRPSPFWSLPK